MSKNDALAVSKKVIFWDVLRSSGDPPGIYVITYGEGVRTAHPPCFFHPSHLFFKTRIHTWYYYLTIHRSRTPPMNGTIATKKSRNSRAYSMMMGSKKNKKTAPAHRTTQGSPKMLHLRVRTDPSGDSCNRLFNNIYLQVMSPELKQWKQRMFTSSRKVNPSGRIDA